MEFHRRIKCSDEQNSVASDPQEQCCCLSRVTCLGVFTAPFSWLFVNLITANVFVCLVVFLTGELNQILKNVIILHL